MDGGRCKPESRRSRRCCVLQTGKQVRNAECGMRSGRGSFNSALHTQHSALGFTLIELLVVITVIAILAGLVAPMVFSHVGDAKVSAARAQIELFGLALEAYRLDNDYYPSTAQGLEGLRVKPIGEPEARNWRG